jgi:hypothetical protein
MAKMTNNSLSPFTVADLNSAQIRTSSSPKNENNESLWTHRNKYKPQKKQEHRSAPVSSQVC